MNDFGTLRSVVHTCTADTTDVKIHLHSNGTLMDDMESCMNTLKVTKAGHFIM
jgi:hypothetical protein